jgi:hypothetical protein
MSTDREIIRDLEDAIRTLDRIMDGEGYTLAGVDAVAERLERLSDRIEDEPGQVGLELIEADEDVTLYELAERERIA